MENNTLISDLFLLFLMVGGIVLIYKLVMNHYEEKERKAKEEDIELAKKAEKSYIARRKTIEKILKDTETSTIQIETNTTITKPKKSTISPYPNNYNEINKYPIDEHLIYLPDEDYYILEDYSTILTPTRVSLLVESFFLEFNSDYWAEKKAIERGLEDPQQILDEWECKGVKARELGMFLHTQIGNYLQNKPLKYVYKFSYNSEYVSIIEKYDIRKELSYFRSFIKENKIIPYRTEWSIVDTKYMIAGTIDLLCKDGASFILYDWKRSKKIGWEASNGFYIDSNNWGKYGFGELENIADHRFNRYCLQQNLYKYILESNYGMKISKMYLVVLHPDYSKYHLLEVPNMQKKIKYMLEKNLILQK